MTTRRRRLDGSNRAVPPDAAELVRLWPAHELAGRDGFPSDVDPATGGLFTKHAAAELLKRRAAVDHAPAVAGQED